MNLHGLFSTVGAMFRTPTRPLYNWDDLCDGCRILKQLAGTENWMERADAVVTEGGFVR